MRGFLILVLVALEVTFVVSLSDVFFYLEELDKGGTARALLAGLDVPHHQLAAHYYEGGAFVAAHLKALAFLLVGPNVLAHKLVAVVWCALVLTAGHRLLVRHVSSRAAALFGLLFILGPESFQKLALLHLGNHWDATLFEILLFDKALSIAFRGETRTRDFALWGVLAGFGCFFSYQIVVVAAVTGVWLLWHQRRHLLRAGGPALLAGCAVGLVPLWIMIAHVGGEVFDVHGLPPLRIENNLDRIGAMVRSLVVDASPRELLSFALYPSAAILAAVYARTRAGAEVRARATLLIVFSLTWIAVYATGPFATGSVVHYALLARWSPLWIAAALLLAAALDDALRAGSRAVRGTARTAVVALAALGITGAVAIIAEGRPETPLRNLRILAETRGYRYPHTLKLLLGHLSGGERERLGVLTRLDEDRRLLYPAIAEAAFREEGRGLDDVLAVLTSVDPEGRDEFLRGLGAFASAKFGPAVSDSLDAAQRLGRDGELLAEAIGRFGTTFFQRPAQVEAEVARNGAHALAEPYLLGVGWRIYRRFVTSPYGGSAFILKPEAALRWIDGFPPSAVPLLRRGFEEAREVYSLGDRGER